MEDFSYLSNADPKWIEQQYKKFQEDPDSIEQSWRTFFEGFEFAKKDYSSEEGEIPEHVDKEFKVQSLINGYRTRGHLFTKTNPVRERRNYSPKLYKENFGLGDEDLETVFQAGNEIGLGPAKLKDIIDHLKDTYCRSIGAEYRYIRKPEKVQWLEKRMEPGKNDPNLSLEEKKRILNKLNQALVFEKFLHTRFIGQKRFSLEGGESLIPALDKITEYGAENGVEEFIFGMAHRGRLNVLANIFNKTYKDIFSEFEPKDYEDDFFDGDVKYHLGHNSKIKTSSNKEVNMALAPNPSHLESVGPIVEGISRAKIDQNHNGDDSKVTPVLIHGDAAIAGQGVVYEIVQMARLKGYKTGGTIHLVINNQVGFTTNYIDGRSSTYCTDVGKVTLSPVFHVNGDDPEALVHTIKIAMDYRQKFKNDVFIDLLCYRKHGHNEGDEPKFTQPLLYKAISKHPDPKEIYVNYLLKSNTITKEEVEDLENEFKDLLHEKLRESRKMKKTKLQAFGEDEFKKN
ncbi:MAG: thiamine pyrophosphate-dependent enzyme, partial [Flavobacteriales bacterium]